MGLSRIRTLQSATAIAATALAFTVGALPASASTTTAAGPKATSTKAACNTAIDERLFILSIAEQRIGEVKRLTAGQKAAQIAGIDQVEANLVNVNRPAVNSATTRAAVKAACSAIYADNRVYAVVIPQLFISVRIDEFGTAFAKFNPMIADARAAGGDTTAIEALMATATTHVDTAAATVSGVTPAVFNADPAAVRAAFDAAQAELQAALADVLRALVAYRDLMA